MPNLFADLPLNLSREVFETLGSGENVRIERIISHGHSSPDGFWYDQDEAEWIVVLKGEAKLLLDGELGVVHLTAGEYLLIPAHKKHRVDWTAPNESTIWLAVFFDEMQTDPESNSEVGTTSFW